MQEEIEKNGLIIVPAHPLNAYVLRSKNKFECIQIMTGKTILIYDV